MSDNDPTPDELDELASIDQWEPGERFGIGTDPDRNQHDWMTDDELLHSYLLRCERRFRT